MRRAMLAAVLAVLTVLVGARAAQAREETAAVMTDTWDTERYNVLDLALPAAAQTAGSSLIGQMDRYFFSREPTEKNVYTGRLAGRDLILILAENWTVPTLDESAAPAARRLWAEGARFTEFYAPDWYQDTDGREFALLTGMVPTAVDGETAMACLGHGDVYLPFALARALAGQGYTCQVRSGRQGMATAYAALGFEGVKRSAGPAADLEVLAGQRPFFVYYALDDADPEPTLEALLAALEERGMADQTVVCVVAGHDDPLRGHLFLWAEGMAGAAADEPCSELDVTATLLDLFGVPYDSRLLSGRDAFAPWDADAGGPEPLVSLGGSAFCDWVASRGTYMAREERFFPAEGAFDGSRAERQYAARMCRTVYDRYIYARRVMENDYFRLVMGR